MALAQIRKLACQQGIVDCSIRDRVALTAFDVLQRLHGPASYAFIGETEDEVVVGLYYEPRKKIEFEV